MAVKDGLVSLLADVDQTLLPLVVVGGNGGDLPVSGVDDVSAAGLVEVDYIVDGVDFKAVDENVVIEGLLHCLVSIDVQNALCPVAKMLVPVDQVGGEPVVHMAVGDKQCVHLAQIQPVGQGMAVGIRGKIQ